MKKVLILAYDFPPYVSVGALRPYNWHAYFHEFGVYPIVVTRQWSNNHGDFLDYIEKSESPTTIYETTDIGTIIRTPYRPNLSNRLLLKYGENRFVLLRKSISAFYEFAQFVFPVGPKVRLYYAAKNYLKKNNVDAIIATGDPFVLFNYASRLSDKFFTPWIADYRDPWSQNVHFQQNTFIKNLSAFFEKRTLRNAESIVTVSEFLKVKISQLIKNKPFHVLPNGYNPDNMNQLELVPQGKDYLQIAFMGTIYEWHPLESFLRVLANFLEKQPTAKVKCNFYGINIPHQVESLIHSTFPTLKSVVTLYLKLPNATVLEKLAQNNAMLLFNDYSYMGTKIFDYLCVRRKIILCYADDLEAKKLKADHYAIEELPGISNQLQADLIQETQSGIVVKDAAELFDVFSTLWAEFEQTGQIACNSSGIENYSRKVQVENLAEIIQQL